VDPGFGRTGLGVVDLQGGKTKHVWHGCIETEAGMDFTCRLQAIRDALGQAIKENKPQAAVVEKLFFQTNVSTAINVGMARGVILLVLADAGLPVVELTPNEIKQAVAGYGSADKQQMQAMVTRLLGLKCIPKPDDAADALAIAMAGGQVFLTQKRLVSDR
jgi:crossover junction endodeoxyribonuclease RuvC